MADSKVMIGGSSLSVKGGKAMIQGSTYNIKEGKTLINGTTNSIKFISEAKIIENSASGLHYATSKRAIAGFQPGIGQMVSIQDIPESMYSSRMGTYYISSIRNSSMGGWVFGCATSGSPVTFFGPFTLSAGSYLTMHAGQVSVEMYNNAWRVWGSNYWNGSMVVSLCKEIPVFYTPTNIPLISVGTYSLDFYMRAIRDDKVTTVLLPDNCGEYSYIAISGGNNGTETMSDCGSPALCIGDMTLYN